MRLVFPNSHRINRGNYVVKELAEACRANDITDLIVLHEHRGIPGQLKGRRRFRAVYINALLALPRRYDRLTLSARPNSIFHVKQCRTSPRHWFLQVINRF